MTLETPGIRPRPSLARELDVLARHAFPATTTTLLVILAGSPAGFAGQAVAQAAVALSCVFFWALFRPASMPPLVVFLLGLLVDLVGFAPPGVNILGLLATYGVAVRWRRILVRQDFALVWLVYMAVGALAALLEWAATALLLIRLPPLAPVELQAGLSAGLYPALALLLGRAHATLAEPARA